VLMLLGAFIVFCTFIHDYLSLFSVKVLLQALEIWQQIHTFKR